VQRRYNNIRKIKTLLFDDTQDEDFGHRRNVLKKKRIGREKRKVIYFFMLIIIYLLTTSGIRVHSDPLQSRLVNQIQNIDELREKTWLSLNTSKNDTNKVYN